jgi:hypothetical protein
MRMYFISVCWTHFSDWTTSKAAVSLNFFLWLPLSLCRDKTTVGRRACFCSPKNADRFCGPPKLPFSGHRGFFSPGVDGWDTMLIIYLHLNTKVKDRRSYTSAPTICLLSVDRDNVVFPFSFNYMLTEFIENSLYGNQCLLCKRKYLHLFIVQEK